MKLTKKELIQEGMEDGRMITKFPDESERRAALNKAWLEVHPDEAKEGEDALLQGERTLEIRGTVRKTMEDGETIEIIDGEVLGFNAAFAEEVAPLKEKQSFFEVEILRLKQALSEHVKVIDMLVDRGVSKETTTINPKALHLKNFIPSDWKKRREERELDEV